MTSSLSPLKEDESSSRIQYRAEGDEMVVVEANPALSPPHIASRLRRSRLCESTCRGVAECALALRQSGGSVPSSHPPRSLLSQSSGGRLCVAAAEGANGEPDTSAQGEARAGLHVYACECSARRGRSHVRSQPETARDSQHCGDTGRLPTPLCRAPRHPRDSQHCRDCLHRCPEPPDNRETAADNRETATDTPLLLSASAWDFQLHPETSTVPQRHPTQVVDSLMEDTESSDFLSSYDSLYSGSSATTDRGESYIDFDVVFSDGLDEASKAEEDFENVSMIPNSRLSSADHPVLIRLENEYQARRTFWHQRPGQYCRYLQEVEGRIACPNQNLLTSGGSELSSRKQDKPLERFACTEDAKPESPQGLKRQRTPETELSANWWVENEEQNLAVSEGDRIFAQKCRELQGFIKPLTELLNGLKRGRYERGLSSFQQSVAMDRIQRIVGVLQKPEMGERYLGTLLQVEMMLKIWFPSVTSSSSSPSSDDDMEEPQNKVAKHSDVGSTEQESCRLKETPLSSNQSVSRPSEGPAVDPMKTDCICCNERIQVLAKLPTMNLTWMRTTAPICNTALSQVDLSQLGRALDQDLLGQNPSSCGIIFLVQNGQASRSQPLSVVQAGKLVVPHPCKERKPERPLRSQSAPAVVLCDRHRLETQTHSRSLPNLPTCTQRPVGENT
ncbi:circadian-associated transcriptional repressor [Mixophyes fleayi]|uniref:circadian-associated transcriptional repressor n=1 Tax=Mixophyes fleayi TaxID=3061075 RepID=UPI003F4E3262